VICPALISNLKTVVTPVTSTPNKPSESAKAEAGLPFVVSQVKSKALF